MAVVVSGIGTVHFSEGFMCSFSCLLCVCDCFEILSVLGSSVLILGCYCCSTFLVFSVTDVLYACNLKISIPFSLFGSCICMK